MKTYHICLLVTLVLIDLSSADLPIHCLNSQIAGIWKFEFNRPRKFISAIQNDCGHEMPDSENTSLLAMKDQPIDSGSFVIELMENGSIDDTVSFKKMNNNKMMDEIM